ncbi:CRE-HYLS-1 protein [Caenorhabditis remanei]|uniref:CRE-HYLS-1 protein n=1 Tax=Caenorhabditis remanei TaxID=31234 RepID=E3N1T1_CAERE|nr:CRE-HYLS-1 protein [Caenorhabditis remanei]
MADFTTEKELEDIIHQMGQHIQSGVQLAKLKNEINKYLHEESYLSESDGGDDVLNESLFASLSIDPAARFLWRQREDLETGKMNIQSPIVSRKRQGKRYVYENLEFPDVNDSDGDDEKSAAPRENFEAKSLIDQAWRSIHRAYETCRGANEVVFSEKNFFLNRKMLSSIREVFNKLNWKFFKKSSDSAAKSLEMKEPKTEVTVENPEEQVMDKLSSDGGQPEDLTDEEVEDEEEIAESVSVGLTSSENPSDPKKSNFIIRDPSVRPVRSPKPGRVPYKFDPVTRYHLYKNEWERHPAPGELRRLSLRWKVREFMLRHDVPRLTANPEGKAIHEKQWSPQPYMD